MEGWICLHRKILDNPVVCKSNKYFGVWIYLLLNATHKEIEVVFKGKKIKLKRGQLITNRKDIANKLKISESTVQKILVEFEKEHQIEQQTSSKNRLISILNYDYYQKVEQQKEQQSNNKVTTKEQQSNNTINNNNDNNETIYINNNIYNTEEKIEKKFEPSEAIKKAKALFAKNR